MSIVIFYIAPLPLAITDLDLRSRFGAFGDVVNSSEIGQLEANGATRRYAHVAVKVPTAADDEKFIDRVCRTLTGTKWKGVKIQVQRGRPKTYGGTSKGAEVVRDDKSQTATTSESRPRHIVYRYREAIRPDTIARSIRPHGQKKERRIKTRDGDGMKAPDSLFGGDDEPGVLTRREPGRWLFGHGRLLTIDPCRYRRKKHVKWEDDPFDGSAQPMRLSGGQYMDEDQSEDGDDADPAATSFIRPKQVVPSSSLSGIFAPKIGRDVEEPFTLFGPSTVDAPEEVTEPIFPREAAPVTTLTTSQKTTWPLFFPHEEPQFASMTLIKALTSIVMTCPLPDPTAVQFARPTMGRKRGDRDQGQSSTPGGQQGRAGGGLPDFLTGANANAVSRSSTSLPANSTLLAAHQEGFFGMAHRDPEACLRRWKERKRNLTLGFKKMHRETSRKKGRRKEDV